LFSTTPNKLNEIQENSANKMINPTSNRRATHPFSLYLGDLSALSTPENVTRVIEDEFKIYGFEVRICLKSNGVHLKYGFLDFLSPEACQDAHTRLQGGFRHHGRAVRIGYGGYGIVDASPFNALRADVDVYSVYVQGISLEPINVADLEVSFGKHGKVIDICIFEAEQVRRY
jgi:hypothetical protein